MTTTHLHVPIVGELVSPTSGSAIVTVARALGDAHIDAGGAAAYVVRQGLGHDTQRMGRIDAAVPDKVWLTTREKIVDRTAGALTGRYPRTDKLWEPVYEAIPVDHVGPVFLHNAPAAAAGLARVRPAAIPVVHFHNEVLGGWTAAARSRLVQRHRVVAVSRFVADRIARTQRERDRVLVLLNGSDTRRFTPSASDVEPTVLFVGKVTPHKGAHLLVRAARLLAEEGIRFRLRIVGSAMLQTVSTLTEYELELRKEAEPLGGAVEFVPFVDRSGIADIYRSASIMVVPSVWDEPCSLTLPEAMSSGLACVASRRGGLPEVGADAVRYVDGPGVEGLAAHLRVLLSDEDARRAAAVAARARAEEISWDNQLALLNEWLAG